MRMTPIILTFLILIIIDLYVFYGIRSAYLTGSPQLTVFTWAFWLVSITLYGSIFWTLMVGGHHVGNGIHRAIIATAFILLVGKLFFSVFLLIDDVGRIARYGVSLFDTSSPTTGKGISRYRFIVNGGLLAGTGIVSALSYGIIKGAHDYRVIRQKIKLPHLPDAFEGLKLLQISDIHSGSFWNKRSVKRGIQMVKDQHADIIFFTGDLVNNLASEMDDYKELFKEINAPLGIYSVLGNHDYAEYLPDLSKEERDQNLVDLIKTHQYMGWDILMNEHRILEKNGEKIGIIGIENWSAHSNFPRHGKLSKAYEGTGDLPVKLLLSHDPSHWKAEVLKDFPDIDVTFSGHTHGMQIGIETGGFKWSPVKYLYPEWAGLYQENNQYLYVNRGFGYLGYPGRLGIRPEITVFEFSKG